MGINTQPSGATSISQVVGGPAQPAPVVFTDTAKRRSIRDKRAGNPHFPAPRWIPNEPIAATAAGPRVRRVVRDIAGLECIAVTGGTTGATIPAVVRTGSFSDGTVSWEWTGRKTRQATQFERQITITGITNANPGVVTAASHGYNNGDSIYLYVVGMPALNGLAFRAANVTTNTFELQGVNTTSLGTFVSGTAARNPAGITVSTGTTLRSGYAEIQPFTNQGRFLMVEAPVLLLSAATGGACQASAFSNGGSSDTAGLGVGRDGAIASYEFVVDDQYPQIGFWSPGSTRNFDIEIDDVPLEVSPQLLPAVGGGGVAYLNLDLGSAEVRNIKVRCGCDHQFRGVAIAATSKLLRPDFTGPLGIIAGDSLWRTRSSYETAPRDTVAEQFGIEFGLRHTRTISIGSTGYDNAGTGTGSPFTTGKSIFSSNAYTDFTPDYIVIAYGINEVMAFGQNPARVISAIYACLNDARATYPRASIGVFGVHSGTNNPSANGAVGSASLNAYNLELAIASAVIGTGDSNIVFAPLATQAGGAFVSGTGRRGVPVGDGNSELQVGADGTHWSISGSYYAGKGMAVIADAAFAFIGR